MNSISGANRRVLLIDDDELSAIQLKQRLERRGMHVVSLADTKSVLDTIAVHQIEVVLLDIVMPVKDGISVLKEIRQAYAKDQLPVIMTTMLNENESVIEAFKLGANDYITKPINVDVAIARISAHLGLADLYVERLRINQLETVNALVATCNHEINNPLAIALACLQGDVLKDEKTMGRLNSSLWRIADIVKKIKHISSSGSVEYEPYAGTTKMIKVKK